MLTNIYVIDYILKDLDGSKDRLDRIFGTEPLWLHPDMMPGQTIEAMYYQSPGNGEMTHAIGFFQQGANTLAVTRDRLWLIGIMCHDIEKTMCEIAARGLNWVHPEPQGYAVGRNNSLGILHGLEIFVAEHVPGGDKKAREMMFTKDGTSDFGDDTQGGLFLGFSGIDLVVEDFEAAMATYMSVFGVAPQDTTRRTNAAGVRSAHFPAPGNGRGMREIGLFAADGSGADSPLARRLAQALTRDGEGVFRLDLRVTDVGAIRALLESRGLVFEGEDTVLADVHGADIRYVADR
jgi:predicted enzyme related to lactoylglutathione lyase